MEQTSTGVGQQAQASVDGSLQTTLQRFAEAFNRLDPKEFATFLADDATILNPLGHFASGRGAGEKLFRDEGTKLYEGSTSRLTIVAARKLRDDCVLLDVDNDVQNFRQPDGTRGPMKMHITFVAQRKGEQWQWLDIRAFTYMQRPQPLH